MRTLISASCLAAALALSCTACGSSGSDDHASSFPTAAAKAAASKVLLSASDFPSDWTTDTSGSESASDDAKYQEKFAGCLGVPRSLIGTSGPNRARAETPDFDSKDGNVTVSESVTVGTKDHTDQVFDALHKSNITDCLSQAMDAYMNEEIAKDDGSLKGATLGDLEVEPLSTGTYGDDTVAMRVSVPVTAHGQSVTIYLDGVYVRHGNAYATLDFEGVGTPVGNDVSTRYTRLAAQKLEKGSFPSGS